MNRRTFLHALSAASLSARSMSARESAPDPWPQSALWEPAALAAVLLSPANRPQIISVTFPVLYRARHIRGAALAGPANKAEGIEALKDLASQLAKTTQLVIYCGCCPMAKCPNIRPAYQALKDLAFTNVRVLNLPTSLHVDWTQKGFPVEPPSS